jgi:hypothetical protein
VRFDDTKRGGDIDILIFSQKPSLDLSQKVTRDFLTIVKKKLMFWPLTRSR